MTSTITVRLLFSYECQRVCRSPVIWLALAVLLVSGTWGAHNTARLHAEQKADLTRMAQQEADWYADVRIRAARYSQPSADEVPYWQDPTSASGFSRYFLRRFAAKPHLPLSALSAGQSDLQPFAVPLRLETLFGGDRVYDYEPPRALSTGLFDLGFVLVFVAPLCVGWAAVAFGALERDQGILPVIAAQPISPRRWWLARLMALSAVLIPGVVMVVVVALLSVGAPVIRAWPETGGAISLVAAHTLLWLVIGGWCLARGHGVVASASIVTTLWLLFTVATPIAGTLALQWSNPRPSPITEVSELRRVSDQVQREADAVVTRHLVKHLGIPAAGVNPASLDYSTRLVAITQEMERRLEPQERRRQDYARTADRIARVIAWLSPQAAFHTALADLAGTGTSRHRDFLQAVRAFQLELRAFMYPRVLEPVMSPISSPCIGCPGRLTFAEYDVIPRFAFTDTAPSVRSAAAIRTAAWFALLALAVGVVAILKGGTWALAS
jgi:ABC-2 type transport system permease protein